MDISGSIDKTIRFWRKQSDSWSLSFTIDAGGIVSTLNLNANEDKLIACISKNQIIAMNLQSKKVMQVIQVNEFGYRLCFTIQDQFVLQPCDLNYLEVYDYDESKEQFYQKTKIKVQSFAERCNLFFCQYIKTLNILIVKYGQFLNIFKVNMNGKYQLIQYIEFQDSCHICRMTEDAEYLVTWNRGLKMIQVRKLSSKDEQN